MPLQPSPANYLYSYMVMVLIQMNFPSLELTHYICRCPYRSLTYLYTILSKMYVLYDMV